ncbi:MAG: DUF6788 family protein [Acidimicrobiales bacterium]
MKSEQRRQAILKEIARLGPIIPGTISERFTRCAGPICRCRADPPLLHGPYSTWTHRVDGRQITKALKAEEVKAIRAAITANHRLHELIKELEALSIAEVESRFD